MRSSEATSYQAPPEAAPTAESPAPRGPGLSAVVALQRSAGNQATVRALTGTGSAIQRVVTVNGQPYAPSDDVLDRLLKALAARGAKVPPDLRDRLRAAIADQQSAPVELRTWLEQADVGAAGLDEALVESSIGGGFQHVRALAAALFTPETGPLADIPGEPAIFYLDRWYSRAALRAKLTAELPDFWKGEPLAALDALPLGSRFTKVFELFNAVTAIMHKPKPPPRSEPAGPDKTPPEVKEKEPEKREPEKATTSLHASLPEAEETERELGRLAATSGVSLGVAAAMAGKVVEFLDRWQDGALYPKVGTASRKTAGAVGTDPEAVRDALASGTLHERLTHVLNFKSVFEDLCQPPTGEQALALAKELGFDTGFITDKARHAAAEKQYDELYQLKTGTVKKVRDDAPNTRSEQELGIPFSSRERAHWGQATPSFEVGSAMVEVGHDTPFAKEKETQGFPVKSGPSTHTFEIFAMHELLGLQGRLTLDEIMLAATGYLLPIGAHSLIEIQHVAELFGLPPAKSPELYGRLLVALKREAKQTEKTAADMRKLLSTDFDNFHEAELAAAHHRLLSAGFVFIAYHGTNKKAGRSIHRGGFDPHYEKRAATDPWRGAYVAPSATVAQGYMTPVENPKDKDESETVMLRIYCPGELIRACVEARLPLDDARVLAEITRRLGTGSLAPPHGDYLILGRERSHADGSEGADSLEAIVSWSIAVQCIALPSLHTAKKLSEFELGLPVQVTLPETLSAEQGVELTGGQHQEMVGEPGDPRAWKPSGATATFEGPWDPAAYVQKEPRSDGPDHRETEILRRLGFDVRPAMRWADVAEQTIVRQINAFTIVELLENLAEVPPHSPIWTDVVRRMATASEYSMVVPGLFLSGWQAAVDLPWLEANVKAVLNCTQFEFPKAQGIAYEHVTVTDYSLGMFEWASGVIARAVNQGILVHCVEGKNRSATLATGYLMKAHHLNREQATRLVTSRRPWASPDANALAGWEHHLVKLGLLAPRAGTSPAKTGKDSDEWIGHDLAVQLSMASLVSQVLFESAGTAIGLDKYLELHNASGAANNCLIYSLAGALGQVLSDERIAEIGAQVRKAGVGVEASGFLNAQAVPAILGHLGAAGRRVVIIDTTGKVTSPQIAPDEDTYSAEIVNASGGGTLVIVNQSNVHFGYAHLRDGRRCHAVDDDATDGNHWVQFTGAAMIPHPLGTQSPTTMHALAIMHLQPAQDLTLERIRAQYRKLALSLHPDKSTAPDAAERFKELRRAYGHLTGEDETASGEVRALQYQ